MSKRFTATEKWDDPWFFNLSNNNRMLWEFLCDKCNHAGIWDPNWKLARFYLRFTPDIDALGGRVVKLPSGKYFIPGFVAFQYGKLIESNRAHASVISILKKEGAWEGLNSSIQGATDKDTDTDKDKDKDKAVTRNAAFREPTLEEITAYCRERNNKVDPVRWQAFYAAKGWMIGKNKMKDWRAAVRTWELEAGFHTTVPKPVVMCPDCKKNPQPPNEYYCAPCRGERGL